MSSLFMIPHKVSIVILVPTAPFENKIRQQQWQHVRQQQQQHYFSFLKIWSSWVSDVQNSGFYGLCVLNPLSPSIHIQILQNDLHTFPLRISWENLIKHQGIFSFMIIFYILTTLSLDNVLTLLALKAGLKGLKRVSCHVGFSQVYVKCCSILYLLLLINAVKDKCSHTIMLLHAYQNVDNMHDKYFPVFL